MNYSLGYVYHHPGNATDPLRLSGTSELVYVIEGFARIKCDGAPITIRTGEVVLLPEAVLQSIANVGTTDLHYLSAIQPPYSDEIDIRGGGFRIISHGTPS